MCFFIKAFLFLLPFLNQAQRFKLQGSKPLYMNCIDINESDNGFVGNQYFYDQLSQSGSLVNLDKITFTLWINVYQKYKLNGKQILFAFVDGNTNNPYLNLILYYTISSGQYTMTLSNERFSPEIVLLPLSQQNDLYIGSWCHIVLSIDQSTSNTFINLKFFSTYDNSLNQIQDVLVNQKLKYKFGVHSRITNEQLFKSSTDYKACVNIANFYYINGWTTMDSETYMDYDLELKFFLKPYRAKGFNVNDQFMNVALRQYSNPVFLGSPIGLYLYKNTQIVYTFMEDLGSLTMMFWIKPMNIVSLFQFISLTDDALQQTSIGFGVSSDYYLQFHQNYGKSPLGKLEESTWAHVTVGVLELSYNSDFIPTSSVKLLRVFINKSQVEYKKIYSVIAYKRLILGPIFTDDYGDECIDIQDIKIYKGYGIQKSQGDCRLFVSAYCAFCRPDTHYCKEQDPTDDDNIYTCAAGYKETPNGCSPITIQNCLRQSGPQCAICADNYNLSSGSCTQINPLVSPYECDDPNAIFCRRTIYRDNSKSTFEQSKLCKLDYGQQSNQFYCENKYSNNCVQAQFQQKCYKCNNNYYLTEQNTCQVTCTQLNKFQSNGVCLKKCPFKYYYTFNCYSTSSLPQYYCSSQKCDQQKELDLDYYCLNYFYSNGKYKYCTLRGQTQENEKWIDCHSDCKYCFGWQQNQCLGCYSNKFFSPYDTKCVDDCNDLKYFKYNNRDKMVCELECPSDYFTQDLECVRSCKIGYALYNKKICQPDTQITDNFVSILMFKSVFVDCPQVCQTCTSQTICTSCLNNYILTQNSCPVTCYPKYLYIDEDDVSHCLTSCDPTDLVYDNSNIDGYKIRQCFKLKCGFIQLGRTQQTYLHQTKPLTCVYPCDPDHYPNQNNYSCVKCDPICLNCQNSATFCTKCQPGTYLQDNSCFTSCKSKFKNYYNNQCEGTCSSGYAVIDKALDIQACVQQCGMMFSMFLYTLNTQCYQAPPVIGAYCVGYQCYNCYYKCKTCTGPNYYSCSSCYDKTFLLDNKCGTNCDDKYYDLLNWKCVDVCPSNVYTTSGYQYVNGNLTFVTSCSSTCLYDQFQFQGKCTDIQPEGTYYTQKSNYKLCDKCTAVCLTCFDSYSTTCTECNVGSYLYDTTCSSECPDDAPYKDTLQNLCVVTCTSYQENGYCVAGCSDNYYTYDAQKQCYELGCPEGTFNLANTLECYACALGCATCTDGSSSSCITCIEGYFLLGTSTCTNVCNVSPDLIQDWINGKCAKQCPAGTYLQTLASGQLACKDTCPVLYYSNICVAACPAQTYADGIICTPCAGPCSVCFGELVNQCTKCDSGYYLADTSCVDVCPNSKPYANLADQTCVSTCPDYLYLAKKICFSPCPGFLAIYQLNGKKECVDQCYSKSYLSSGNCLQCNAICKECYGPINGNCLQCEAPNYLYQQKCSPSCPSQLYTDLIDRVCRESCPSNTVIQGQKCQAQCDATYLLYGQFCVATCPAFTYKSNTKCLLCNPLCRSCSGPLITTCSSCIENYLLDGTTCTQTCPILYDYEAQKCVSTCNTKFELTDLKSCVTTCPTGYIKCNKKCLKTAPDGYYSDGISCLQCNSKCTKCTSQNVCQACSKNNFLSLQTCGFLCTNKYLYMDSTTGTCVTKCPPQLYHQESYDRRTCVEDCLLGYKLNDQCVSSCPKGMYTKDNFCTNCPQTCEECTSATNCTVCIKDHFLENGLCYISCLVGKTDYKNNSCVSQCDPSLFEYQNQCLVSCPTDPVFYYHSNICMDACPESTYQNKQECLDCDVSCLSCIGPSNNDCLVCKDTYYLHDQQCILTCPNLYNEVDKTCVLSCPPNLLLDGNKCVLICSQYMYDNTCLSSCPIGAYDANYICFDCSENCLECNSFGCTKCGNGTFLNDGSCSSFCPYFYNIINYQCEQQCPEGTYLYIDQCYATCPANTYTYLQTCLLECPLKTILLNSVCYQCPERCSVCKSQYECGTCDAPYYQFKGECVVACPTVLPYQNKIYYVCQSECSPDTYEKGYDCVRECDLIIYQNKCLTNCPYGYYGNAICKPCKLECKACNDFNICTECSDNFYLEYNQCETQCTKIKDLKQKKCVDSCSQFLYQNVCYETCPINTYQYTNTCLQKCLEGYFGSADFKCEKCPSQCITCSTFNQCNSCKIGYYLYQKQCLDSCPDKLFSNPLTSQCTQSCPDKTFIFTNSCLYECPSDYFNDTESYKCVTSCGKQQYLNKNSCYPCSFECDQCTAYGNKNCVACATNFVLTEEGHCFGKCKAGYYQTTNSCEQCLHKCLTCQNGTECLQCRGNNRNQLDCSCPKGYYDDPFYDNCQKCPCEECISESECLVCKNNLQVPNCSCNRRLNDDWCITCQIASVNIYYSDDLNQIIVYFGYLISVNLINPFQPSSCSFWFNDSEIFGEDAQCYLSWDRYAVHIILEPYASVNVGDQLSFQQSFYRDVNQGLCDGQFIETFIDSTVKGPSALTKPYVHFDVPSVVSTCKTIEIKQILYDGTGKKIQEVLSWTLKEMDNDNYYLQMDAFLADQKNEFTIPIGALATNVTYTITAKYINFLKRVNFTTFTFTTLPDLVPYVFLQYNPLMARVYVFDCKVTYSDMKNEFNLAIQVSDSDNKTYISIQQAINPIYDVPLNESLLPKETPLLFMASTGSSVIHEKIYLKSKKIEIQFLQKNRFIGLDNQINARAFDRNIQDEVLSTLKIEYQWQCNNLFNLQPCKTEENKIMEFPSRRIADIFADSQNTTFVFFVKASKGNRWTVKEQLIVVTDFEIEEEFVLNQEVPQNSVNLNDEITVLIRNNQKYAFIIQEFKILASIKTKGQTLKFRLSGLTANYNSPVYIYLVPGIESISFKLNVPPSEVYFNVDPLIGESLDYFNYSIQNLQPGNTFSIYYYFDKLLLQDDVNLQSINHGFPLVISSQELTGSFQLPNGIIDNAISVICQIESAKGSKSYLVKEIQVKRNNYQINKLYESLNNQTNFSNLQSIHTMTKLMEIEQQQVCLKQCSGVGTCVDNKCKCPPEYYFDDCSGTREEYDNFSSLISNALQQLIKNPITNDDEFRLFSQSLLYLSTLKDLNSSITNSDCQQILEQYIQNLNTRLEKINQYSINLQYQSTAYLNYSQIDIRSLENQNDLGTALKSTVFMWAKTLFTEDSAVYQLQSRLRSFLSAIIELSLFGIEPNESIDYSFDTAFLKMQRINNISNITKGRLLVESTEVNSSNSEYYDVVQAIYIRNYFAFDGYYPYPLQLYPLYDYQIRQENRKQNIQLSSYISYKFKVLNDTTNLVCLMRNSLSYEWSNENCTLDQQNTSYFCNCTNLAPTTICNDYDYLFQNSPKFQLKIPNLLYIIYFAQLLILGIFFFKSRKSQYEKSVDNNKFGQVLKLAKHNKIGVFGNKIVPIDDEKQVVQDESKQNQNQQQPTDKDKFSFNNFWKYHFLTSMIYKKIFYFSSFQRSVLILLRWNQAIIVGEVLTFYGFNYDVAMWIILSSIIFSRIFEYIFKTQVKYFFYMKQIIVLILTKLFLFLIMLGTFLFGIYVYLIIYNQTNLIISYTFAIIIDFLFLDIILFSANKFFGQEKKKLIRKKLKEFQFIAKAQNVN
ncbi:unnamed protein product (macronuclear) [Paramecium tetraurelia]|uniref:TNFR-Cys domain-containing protein n=1 Tax=Paramecium tetraurelia TaxID=5888 RepID=A0CJP7_PARTE|nr:uncharacterized protein GSPATT00000726001 [Paramecium tetraurelia]CAK71014.1 unnamed protein product [Paramecium tetraurelia]|eukprot:XP_001438411.1 hypothetical protein (macronuclear) [Paramecium tetraurelia strain d4-2]